MKFRPPVGFVAVVFALSFNSAIARFSIDSDHCDVESDYSTRLGADRITFTNDKTHHVVVLEKSGRIEIDGTVLSLSADDRQRAVALARAIQVIVPQAKALAVDAVGIAFEAVGQASTAFASDAHQARESAERISRAAAELTRAINAREDWGPQSDKEISSLIEGSVGSLIGEMIGNITAQAISVALSGDEAAVAELQARAGSIEKNVEKAVGKHAKELGQRADALCQRVQELDRIESQFSARMPDGSPIDLIQRKP